MNKLKQRMREKNMTQKSLAFSLGLTIQTVNSKLNGRSDFSLKEVKRIMKLLEIEDPRAIFFE